ncbi:CLUMA_CG021619, isoform A [Clunio marinus]|uniref:CLUMA_CG021619, isoform A n=1 Tax=Clunio marinus TaxID=568069 RepID=A0A1J1J7E1_9DIPT|nr:CLUMA_CG021619, isoform A [Clunio marinus]
MKNLFTSFSDFSNHQTLQRRKDDSQMEVTSQTSLKSEGHENYLMMTNEMNDEQGFVGTRYDDDDRGVQIKTYVLKLCYTK